MRNPPDSAPKRIDVTQVDGQVVKDPLVATDAFDARIASENTRRMYDIMHEPALGDHAVLFFPAGNFYFDGAVEGETASVMSTARSQTFLGVDPSVTRLLQKSTSVEATVRLSHDTCAIRNMYIGSADEDVAFHEDWEAAPHSTAVLLDAPVPGGGVPWSWALDPQLTNVNVNGHGNAITLELYSRPFRNAVEVRGPWLNVYVHTMWINDAYNAVYIEQGPVIAGPAKFIDVNFYRTYERKRSKIWATFFKSERHFMEQVEIIHCTFIGAQFIYMDGRAGEADGGHGTPAYNMVIDHNYINVVANENTEHRQDSDPKWSGIYLNLPPKLTEDGFVHYTRDIRFTNNSCAGRSPADGAFFYMEGMCRGVTFADNDVACGLAERCIYILPKGSSMGVDEGTGIHDIDVTRNYFRTWMNLVTIGEETRAADVPVSRAKRVLISHNRGAFEAKLHHAGKTAFRVFDAEQVVVDANLLAETGGAAIAVSRSEEVIVKGNTARGLGEDASGTGVTLSRVDSGIVSANILARWSRAVSIEHCRNIVVTGNVFRGSGEGLECSDSEQIVTEPNIQATPVQNSLSWTG